jgi:predicted DNA-binding transcriptional regulator YafY
MTVTASGRLLDLLRLLRERRRWRGPDLADRLDVTVRTLRRDMERLRELGYPVRSHTGRDGWYQLGGGGTLPPLLFDDDEAIAVVVGLRAASQGTIEGVADASQRALATLEAQMPARLRRRVAILSSATASVGVGSTPVTLGTLTTLSEACHDGVRVRCRYRDGQGNETDRDLEPLRVVATGRRWYLVARDVDRQAWRTLRLDRMSEVRATTFRFIPTDPPDDPAAMVTRAVAAGPYPFRARVRVAAPADVVVDLVSPTAGTVQPDGPEQCVLTFGALSERALALNVLALGLPVTVEEPPGLAGAIAELAANVSGPNRPT